MLGNRTGVSAWYRQFGERFTKKTIPFGALVHFAPPQEDKVPKPKTGGNAIPGIYLGWVKYKGRKVGPDAHVLDTV